MTVSWFPEATAFTFDTRKPSFLTSHTGVYGAWAGTENVDDWFRHPDEFPLMDAGVGVVVVLLETVTCNVLVKPPLHVTDTHWGPATFHRMNLTGPVVVSICPPLDTAQAASKVSVRYMNSFPMQAAVRPSTLGALLPQTS